MCGIAGFFQPTGFSAADDGESTASRLAATLTHRGPDDVGTWVDAEAGIALSHRRLSVLDLSPAGHQPMVSHSGRYVIVFNGEIYNHREIRKQLELSQMPPAWRGHSDTETLLSGVEHWGVDLALKKAVGMFAFALWDREERVLTLARDRLGEKPMYYGWQQGVLLFGSELKALRAHPRWHAELDRDVAALYLELGYVPAPHSIYRAVHKLMPGTYLQVSQRSRPGAPLSPIAYWSLRAIAEAGIAEPFRGSEEDAIAELEAIIRRAVAAQSIADVPLGAFLSGGIDSTTIVALLQSQSARRLKTFTIGFLESEYQEAEHARAVAAHLGTDHNELCVTPREAMAVIPKLPQLFDEPFGDSSAIPTLLVAQLARRQVTVALSGDGGDELFGGYSRYARTGKLWRAIQRVPGPARALLARSMGLAFEGKLGAKPESARRLAAYLAARGPDDFYRTQIRHRLDVERIVLGARPPRGIQPYDSEGFSGRLLETMMYVDAAMYLPDDILAKVDRTAMHVSLETRVPMLDHRVVEFAWRLPATMKVRNGVMKWPLRRILERHVPPSLTERPKMGFGIPIIQWLRGPLREWAESMLCERRLAQEGIFEPRLVREQWAQCLRGKTSHDSLWHLLAFQAWLTEQGQVPGSSIANTSAGVLKHLPERQRHA